MNSTQLGVDNYRGVHPRSLMMAENVFELALEQSIRIKTFLFHTKAEICKALQPAGRADIVRDTVSCDGFLQRIPGKSQCGHCTSCILPRQSLYTAGLEKCDPVERYYDDVLSNPTKTKYTYGFSVMCSQIDTIADCLVSDDPGNSLTAEFLELARTLAELVKYQGRADVLRAHRIRLFRTYVYEWTAFSAPLRFTA